MLLRNGNSWDSTNAEKLLKYSRENGYHIEGWELGNGKFAPCGYTFWIIRTRIVMGRTHYALKGKGNYVLNFELRFFLGFFLYNLFQTWFCIVMHAFCYNTSPRSYLTIFLQNPIILITIPILQATQTSWGMTLSPYVRYLINTDTKIRF